MYTRFLAVVCVLLGVRTAAAGDSFDPVAASDGILQTTAQPGAESATNCIVPSCPGCPSWMLSAGAEETFLRSHSEKLSGFQPAGRVWLGVENCDGLGVRARYWNFCQTAGTLLDRFNGNDGPAAQFSIETLQAYTVDLEATKRVDYGCWDFLGSLGVRYAGLSQNGSNNSGANPVNGTPPAFVGFNIFNNHFFGTGPTVALEGTRPIGDCGLGFVANLRDSELWGRSWSTAFSDTEVDGGPLDTPVSELPLNILEFQTGLEWSRRVECMKGVVFARGLFEYQRWFATAAPASASAPDVGNLFAIAAPSPRADFYGAVFSVGFSH